MITVVKVSGRPIDHPTQCASLWDAIANAARTSSIVVVHGGGEQVDRRLAQAGLSSQRVDGLRITPPEHMGIIAGVLAGEVNRTLVALLRGAGADAVGIGLSDGGLVRAAKAEHRVELGRVGRVIGGDGSVIFTLHTGGFLPVVSSIATGEDGGLLNVNADDAAAGVARAVGASRVVLLTDVPGVLGADGSTLDQIDPDQVDALIESRVIAGGMTVKARAALATAEACDADVLVGSWADAGELIRGARIGTRVCSRPAAAC